MRYTEIRSNIKYLRLVVKDGGEIVYKIPLFCAQQKADTFLLDHLAWLRKQVEIKSKLPSCQDRPPEYGDGEQWYYMGSPLELHVTLSAGVSGVTATADSLLVSVKGSQRSVAAAILKKWRRSSTEQYALQRIAELIQQFGSMHGMPLYGMPRPEIKIRVMRSRFGSCSSRGILTLAQHLCAFPPHLFDTVLIHELCHLKHMDHSRQFYGLCLNCDPDYFSHDSELKAWARGHPIF
ncbi:MAG: M48 family metallopeptidase [Mailhella sp.]|nr:M48 family metallopeptidase [Mailhella sp.]